jgi:hypothetical protein
MRQSRSSGGEEAQGAGHHRARARAGAARHADHGGTRHQEPDVHRLFGLLAPAGTPPDILDKPNAEAISQTPAYRERMQKIHVGAVGDSPAEFKALIGSELEKLGALMRKIDIKMEQ